MHGHDYYFVTRDEFERDMHLDRFLEYEDLKGHLYGTAFSSIKKVMEAGHVPVMDLHPQVRSSVDVYFSLKYTYHRLTFIWIDHFLTEVMHYHIAGYFRG